MSKKYNIFAAVSDQGTLYFGVKGLFYTLLVAVICSDIGYSNLVCLFTPYVSSSLVGNREANSLLILYFNFSGTMTKEMKNQSIANNSTNTLTSAHETCEKFIAFIKQQYPQLKCVKCYNRRNHFFTFRAQFHQRRLYTHARTLEWGMAHFLLEILRKLHREKYLSASEYKARREELQRRVIMNYAIYEYPNL